MNKEMIISSNGHETRVAILEDDQVAEIFIERERTRGVVGNVYKGRVSKVLPGMQSSFVDLGLERDGFLYVSDVVDTVEEFDRLEDDDEDDEPTAPASANGADGAAATAPTARRRRRRRAGRAARPAAAARGDRDDASARPSRRSRTCSRKGRRSSSRWSRSRSAPRARGSPRTSRMPGRFLVFMPTVDHVGVSRKIESREERAPPARHRPRVPRAARLHRRRHHPHRRRRPLRRKTSSATSSYFHQIWTEIRQKMEIARAPAVRLPGAEPRRQAAARPADRRLHGDPHRQRAGAPARRSSSSSASCRRCCRG